MNPFTPKDPVRKITLVHGVLCLAFAASCGGPRYRVDDVILSDVPISQKRGMLSAEAEMSRAAEEKRKAQADVALDDRDVSVAEAEYAQIKMERDKAQADLRLAKRGKDLNQIEPAEAQLDRDLGRRAGEAKLGWLRARRDHHRAMIEVADQHWASAQRDLELEKARLVQATGKRPSDGFDLGQFERQAAESRGRYEDARGRAEQLRADAERRERIFAERAPTRGPL